MVDSGGDVARRIAIFASYSRLDAGLVTDLVRLIRAAGQSVFRDEDDIAPGKYWRAEIAIAIEECQTTLVFWCTHSANSQEVQQEWQTAIRLGKSVVPILLDSTPLTQPLAEYQAVDMRGRFVDHDEPSTAAKRSRERWETLMKQRDEAYYNDGYRGTLLPSDEVERQARLEKWRAALDARLVAEHRLRQAVLESAAMFLHRQLGRVLIEREA